MPSLLMLSSRFCRVPAPARPGPGPQSALDSDGRAGSRRRGGAKRLGVWESDGDSGGQDSDVLVLATGGLVCANRREFAPVRGSENRISDGLDRDSDEDPSHGGGPSFVPFKFLPGDRMIRIRSVGTLRTSEPPNLRTSEPPNGPGPGRPRAALGQQPRSDPSRDHHSRAEQARAGRRDPEWAGCVTKTRKSRPSPGRGLPRCPEERARAVTVGCWHTANVPSRPGP